MKFDIIKALPNSEIFTGIECCYKNSNELFESALILKNNKKFGISISLMILSVEELIKANSLLNLMVAENNDEKEIYRDLFQSKDLHKSRNKFALFVNELYKLTNRDDVKELEVKFNGDDRYLAEYLMEQKILDKTISNTKIEEETSKNWFSHAHQTKNDGLYVDYNRKWFAPSRFLEKDCEIAIKEVELLKSSISEILEYMIRNKVDIDKIVIELKEFKSKFQIY